MICTGRFSSIFPVRINQNPEQCWKENVCRNNIDFRIRLFFRINKVISFNSFVKTVDHSLHCAFLQFAERGTLTSLWKSFIIFYWLMKLRRYPENQIGCTKGTWTFFRWFFNKDYPYIGCKITIPVISDPCQCVLRSLVLDLYIPHIFVVWGLFSHLFSFLSIAEE